jgi:hypothetical protein
MITKRQIFAFIIIVIFISSLVVVSFNKQPDEKELYVPFYQRLVLVAEYNISLCPDIAIIVERNETNTTANFELIKNINQTLYYAKLGVYDTNDAKTPLLFRWANATNACVARYQVLTNNDFLAMLMEMGVEVTKNTTETPPPISNTTSTESKPL